MKKSGDVQYLKLKEVVDCVVPNLITNIVSDSTTNCLTACSLLITSQYASTGSAERNWSASGFIKNKKRNRLSDGLANDLVFIFSNMKLKKTLENKKESCLK
ncbi:hypothetical protein P9112_011975 [Eukaryota sp. TZLM1-RC]